MSSGAPVETGTPIRLPSVALLCVDSADAYKYDIDGFRSDKNTPAIININKQTPLLFGYMTRLSLTEINLQWAIPNVNERNNTLTLSILNEDLVEDFYRIAIFPTFYLPDDLAVAVETALEDLDVVKVGGGTEKVNFSVAYDPETSEFTIEISTGKTTGDNYVMKLWPPNVGGYTLQDTASNVAGVVVPTGIVVDDLTYMMGLTLPSDSINGYYDSVRSGFASCQYTPYIDIVSNILTKNQNVRDNDTTLRNGQAKLARVYLSNPGCNNLFDVDDAGVVGKCNIVGVRPCIIHREFQTPKVIQWNTTENVDLIDLQVLDRLGYPVFIQTFNFNPANNDLVLGNTANFQFTIQATEV